MTCRLQPMSFGNQSDNDALCTPLSLIHHKILYRHTPMSGGLIIPHSVFQALIAAFAVSGYAATYYRAGSKPFNPVLGETYECIREDKGFRFFSEQVKLISDMKL